MQSKPNKLIPGAIFSNANFGAMRIVKYHDSRNVEIEFIETGFVTTAKASNIVSGIVKDRFKRTVYGVGFSGGNRKNESKNKTAYKHWHGALQRCYDKKFLLRNPTYVGCTVCNEWHNFQNFKKWHDENYPNDGAEYHLDKDLTIPGNKVYGPDGCKYVTPLENSQTAAKRYKIKSPDGSVIDILNLSAFCKLNGLDTSNALKVIKGTKRICKGFTKA